MKIIFCGSGTFALPVFSAISGSAHEVVLAVTQPPRRAGRGKSLQPTEIAQAAEAAGVECCQTQDINDPQVVERLRSLAADVMVVVEFGQFIRLAARESVKKACFNLHGSILPALRGAGPVNWAIINGMETSGVSTFELVDKMDAGAIYRTAEVEIGPDETAGELRERLAELGAKVVLDTLADLDAGAAKGVEQDHSLATLAPKLKKSDGYIDFSGETKKIYDRIRGCLPWPGATAMFIRNGGSPVRVTLTRCRIADGGTFGRPGDIDAAGYVATGDGQLAIISIQPAGKNEMDWKSFVNGYRVSAGDRFEKIETEEQQN